MKDCDVWCSLISLFSKKKEKEKNESVKRLYFSVFNILWTIACLASNSCILCQTGRHGLCPQKPGLPRITVGIRLGLSQPAEFPSHLFHFTGLTIFDWKDKNISKSCNCLKVETESRAMILWCGWWACYLDLKTEKQKQLLAIVCAANFFFLMSPHMKWVLLWAPF